MVLTAEAHALLFTTLAHPAVVMVIPERINTTYFDICRLVGDDYAYSTMVFSIPGVCDQRVAVYCASKEHVYAFVDLLNIMNLTGYKVVHVEQENTTSFANEASE